MNRRRFFRMSAATIAAVPLLALPVTAHAAPATSSLGGTVAGQVGVGELQVHGNTTVEDRLIVGYNDRPRYGSISAARKSLQVHIEGPSQPSIYDPLGQYGFASYKVRCVKCDQQWGDWEKISDEEVENGREIPTEQQVRSLALMYLSSKGFVFTGEYDALCPSCMHRLGSYRIPLTEGVPPYQGTWLTDATKLGWHPQLGWGTAA
jgi:hypothetical protein